MDEQRVWLRARRKRRLRILAVILCVCVLFTTYPDILATLSVFASEVSEQSEGRYISGFTALSDEIREQTVPVGTAPTELLLPDTLEAVVTEMKQPSEDTEDKSEDSGREDAGENDGEETDGGTTGTEDMDGSAEETEEGKPSDTEQEDTETGGEAEDNHTETGDGQNTQPEEDGESGGTDGTTETDNGDAVDTEDEEGSEGSASSEAQESAVSQETHTVTMQEYLAENVIPVQTLENTQTEKQEETVTIDGVTWQSEPEYDGSAEGTYTFTAVLPDGYVLADGVSLPEITVTVESGTDAMIQVLLDRIAALPVAEEYLALEPDMEEDEDAYAEWEEKLYEYAEEALAIWEEYEALTEEQQAMIAEEELEKLAAWVEIVETFSDHAVMLEGSSEHHGESDWTVLTANDTTLSDGKYYLSSDITMSTITVTGNLTLCLNGHTLTHDNSTDGSVIVVESGEFTLCDCQDHWGYTSSFDEGTKTYSCGITGTGGCITGGNGNNFQGGGVYVGTNAVFNMNSGRITGCDVGTSAGYWGGGVAVIGGIFNMSGGYIDGNKANTGGGVYLTDRATFKMSGNAVIMSNEGVGVYCQNSKQVVFTMDTGAIIGNKDSDKNNGAGVFLGASSTFNMFGGIIEGNCATSPNSASGAGIYCVASTVNLTGNCIIRYNKANAGAGGIRVLTTSTISISDNVCITDNYGNGDGTECNVSLGSNPITVTNGLTNDIGVTFRPLSGNANYPVKVVTGTDAYSISDADWSHFSSDNKELKIIKDGNALFLDLPGICDLSGLDLTAEGAKIEPNFQADITTYEATVGNEVEKVGITATLAGSTDGKTIKIKNGTDLPETDMTSGVKKDVPLAVGLNTIEITVTSGSETKTYTIEITREAPAGNLVTILSYKDGVAWTGAGAPSDSDYKLTSDDGKTFLPGLAAPDGTYKIYIGDIDTGVEVTVAGAEVTARVDYYTVTFYDGNTELTAPAQQIVLKGVAASAPVDNPTKTGYTFSKWVTADGGSTEYDFANETVTGKTLVYAGWTPVTYTITYDLAGGTLPAGKTNPADYTIETVDFTLQNPERTGYTFAGWSGTGLAADSTTVTISKGSTGNREYTANWTAKTYGITLNGNGGTGDDLTDYTYGQGAVLPANWTKTGYTFAGWYDNKGCTGAPVTEVSATDTGDKTYWAKWTPQTYQVTFEYYGADGGDAIASKNVTFASTYGNLPVPTRTGYTFKGWYTAEAEGQGAKVDAETNVTTASAHTLHARWKDETAPAQPVLQDDATLITVWTNKQTSIPLKLYDGVGVTELWVSVDGKDYTEVDAFPGGTGSVNYEYAVQSGEHTYQFKAKDAAKNTSVASDTFKVRLDQTPPVFGDLTYENKVTTLWNWIIGKTSMVIHVSVTDTGSGVTEIRYTLTPKDAAGNPDKSQAVEKTAAVRDGEAEITFDKDFRGTIAISCTDVAGNPAAGVTIDTAGTNGVIVEDHAPDITILADRNPADLQQTQQNGVAVSEEYYDSAPALLVTVRDDTDNAITAGIATVTYQVEGGADQPVTVDGSALQAQVSFTIPTVPTGVTKITISTTDNAGNTAEKIITIKVKGPEKEPAAKIDYRQEKLTGLVPGGEYLIDGETCTADQEGHIPIKEGWIDSNLNIIKKGNGSETSDSTAQSLSIPARPAAPNAPELNTRTENSITLKTITGAQYRRTDGTGNWQDSTAFEGLNPKTAYSFRAYYPATDTSFASKESGETEIGTVPTPPTPDKLGIDFEHETLTPASGIEAFSDQGCTIPVAAGSAEDYMGQTVYIRYPASGIFPESRATAVTVPERPATPVPGAADASYPGAMNGAITGLTAGTVYEYRKQNDDGTWGDNWTSAAVTDGKITGLGKGTYEVRVKAVNTVSFRSEAATVGISEKPATKLDTPDIQINYTEETLTGFKPGEKYIINGKTAVVSADGTIKIDEDQLGTTLSILSKGNGKDKLDSDAQSLPIPTRPAKPTPTGVDVSTAGGSGKLTGLTANVTYEVSTDGGKTWVSGTASGSGEITGLSPGTYVVRVKAGAANFASEKSEPATIGAYQIKVTFMVEGAKYKEISVDYGAALTDIPPVPAKENAIGAWCMDEQGTTPAVFTNIIADMTVYAVYTTAYTVTLQGGTGYTLSAQAGSENPVKEGGSFTFRFALTNGYQKTADFAVKVNGVKVELAADGTYTITDIRENQTVTVEGVVKSDGGSSNSPGGGGGDNDDGDGGSEPAPTPTPTPTPTPAPSEQPETTPETTPLVTENEPEGRKPETTPEPEETSEPENNETQLPSEPSQPQPQTPDTTPESLTYTVGKGAVIVTLNNVDETVCTARVADAAAVAHAVLSEEELAEAEQGQVIEIRIDVERLEAVPQEDAEVIVTGIEDCQEQIPGLVMGMYVDISMYMRIGSGDWNAIHATNEPVEIILDIPDELAGLTADFYIMRAHEGEYLLMEDLDETPETITIQTEAFSTYAILYQMQEGGEKKSATKCSLCHICPTFLGICYFIWLAIIIALALVIYLIIRRKRKEEESEEQ